MTEPILVKVHRVPVNAQTEPILVKVHRVPVNAQTAVSLTIQP